MGAIPSLLIFWIIIGLVVAFIASALSKGVPGMKFMLLGINITLLGGIVAVDSKSDLGGYEYLIVLLGLVISVVGLNKKD